MKVLSIRQPWATLIVNGVKDVENRKWSTNERGPLVIHAGLAKPDPQDVIYIRGVWRGVGLAEDHLRRLLGEAEQNRGGIIGMANLDSVRTGYDSPWSVEGQYQFVLNGAVKTGLIPCKGELSMFRMKSEVEAVLMRRYEILEFLRRTT